MADLARIATRLPLLLAPFLISACTAAPIDIAVESVNGRILVRLSQDWGLIFADRKAPCVYQAELFREGQGIDEPIWKIEAVGEGKCRRLGAFIIGTASKGFREVVPLPSNVSGSYRLWVSGIGSGETTIAL